MTKSIIIEKINNSLIPVSRCDTGEILQFDDFSIAEVFANETCDYPHTVLTFQIA